MTKIVPREWLPARPRHSHHAVAGHTAWQDTVVCSECQQGLGLCRNEECPRIWHSQQDVDSDHVVIGLTPGEVDELREEILAGPWRPEVIKDDALPPILDRSEWVPTYFRCGECGFRTDVWSPPDKPFGDDWNGPVCMFEHGEMVREDDVEGTDLDAEGVDIGDREYCVRVTKVYEVKVRAQGSLEALSRSASADGECVAIDAALVSREGELDGW